MFSVAQRQVYPYKQNKRVIGAAIFFVQSPPTRRKKLFQQVTIRVISCLIRIFIPICITVART